jgi:hypothetical protein
VISQANRRVCWIFALCEAARPQRLSGCAVVHYEFQVCRTGVSRAPLCCRIFLGEVRS